MEPISYQVWSDLKNNTKKKAAKINKNIHRTGGGPAHRVKLTEQEQRVLNILGTEAATGMTAVQEAGLSQTPVQINQIPSANDSNRTETLPSTPNEDNPSILNLSIGGNILLATKMNLEINQMDVCGAFLNANLDEELYLRLPEGCSAKFVKLNKSLYGLKGAPRYWNETFNNVIKSKGFVQSEKDYCLFSKCNERSKTWLLLYVDDILFFSSCPNEIVSLRDMLSKSFKMKDMGKINKYLGFEVNQDLEKQCTFLSQKEYLNKLLINYGMNDCKPLSLPIDKNFDFSVLNRESPESVSLESRCRTLVGSLAYLAAGTRPDITAVVAILSRYQSCASMLLYRLLCNILRYLSGTRDYCLKYECCESVVGYVDSDWGGSDDRRSTTGCCFKLWGCTVMWFTRKQQSVSLSSTEAEFCALSHATSEACWLKDILAFFGFHVGPIVLYEDNQSAIKMAQMTRCLTRVKHLDIKQSFVKEKINKGIIVLKYINTTEQVADIFTKALGGIAFKKLRHLLFSQGV